MMAMFPDRAQAQTDAARLMLAALRDMNRSQQLREAGQPYCLPWGTVRAAIAAAEAAGISSPDDPPPTIDPGRRVWLRSPRGRQTQTTWAEFALSYPDSSGAMARALARGGQATAPDGTIARLW